MPAGGGPRHLVFHPNGKFAFLLFELKNLVTSYAYADGVFTPVMQLSLLPEDFKVFSKAYTVALSEAIAGSTYPLEDYLSDLDRYAIGQLRGGTILPGQDLTAALYINNLIGKSGTLKAIFKDAVSDKDFAAA